MINYYSKRLETMPYEERAQELVRINALLEPFYSFLVAEAEKKLGKTLDRWLAKPVSNKLKWVRRPRVELEVVIREASISGDSNNGWVIYDLHEMFESKKDHAMILAALHLRASYLADFISPTQLLKKLIWEYEDGERTNEDFVLFVAGILDDVFPQREEIMHLWMLRHGLNRFAYQALELEDSCLPPILCSVFQFLPDEIRGDFTKPRRR